MAMLTMVMSSRVMKRPRQSTARTAQGLLVRRLALAIELTQRLRHQFRLAAPVGVHGCPVSQPRKLHPGGVGQRLGEAVAGRLQVGRARAAAEEKDVGLD